MNWDRFAIFAVFLAAQCIGYSADARAFGAAKPGEWSKTLPPMTNVDPDFKRTIIHIHSVFSHDACDGKPFLDGKPNEICFEHLQRSFCDLNVDIVFITEHSVLMGKNPFEDVWHSQPRDVPIIEEGQKVGLIRTCNDGHRVHVYLGAENDLMPIGLIRHPDTLPGMNWVETYEARDNAAARKFREAGAIVGLSHTEGASKSIEYIQNADIDFLEIYNLHAEFRMLREQKRYFRAVDRLFTIFEFMLNPWLEPDLLFLGLQTENQSALDKWSALVLSRHITGTAGTDAHENAWTAPMRDRERFDSYRRMQRWFSNYVYAPDPSNRVAVLDSIRDGKLFVVFEVYGIPRGFDFSAESSQSTAHMGDTMTHFGRYSVRMKMPELLMNGQVNADAELEGRILKATPQGWTTVAQGSSSVIEFQSDEPGVYRAEVTVVPEHLMRFVPGMVQLDRKHVWIYSNPIWVR